MMRRILVLVTAIFILTTLATAAQAQRPGRLVQTRSERWDFSIQTRYTNSKDYQGDGGSSVHINSDLGWGFGFAYNFNQRFNLGVLFNWRSVPYQSTAIDAENPGETNTYSGQMSTSLFGLTGDWNILKGRFTPYVSGTLGWLHINTNILAGWTSGCWWDPWWGYRCGPVPLTYGANTTVYGLGAGARYEVSESVFLRLGYEHGWTSNNTLDSAGVVRFDLGFML